MVKLVEQKYGVKGDVCEKSLNFEMPFTLSVSGDADPEHPIWCLNDLNYLIPNEDRGLIF